MVLYVDKIKVFTIFLSFFLCCGVDPQSTDLHRVAPISYIGSDFADFLFDKREFDRAATEYYKFIFIQENTPDPIMNDLRKMMQTAYFQIGNCYYYLAQYEQAIAHFKYLINRYPEVSDYLSNCIYKIGLSYFQIKNYDSARIYFSNTVESSMNFHLRNNALFMLGILDLKGSSKSIEKARKYLDQIDVESDVYTKKTKLLEEIEKGNLVFTNPILTGFLSIIPGLGYISSGNFLTAASTITLMGVLGIIDYELFSRQLILSGIFLFVVDLAWYFGSIYGSVTSANRNNDMKLETLLQNLDKTMDTGLLPESCFY